MERKDVTDNRVKTKERVEKERKDVTEPLTLTNEKERKGGQSLKG